MAATDPTTPLSAQRIAELKLLWKRRHQPSTCTQEQHDEAKHEFIREMDDAFPDLIAAAEECGRVREELRLTKIARDSWARVADAFHLGIREAPELFKEARLVNGSALAANAAGRGV